MEVDKSHIKPTSYLWINLQVIYQPIGALKEKTAPIILDYHGRSIMAASTHST